MNPMGWALVFYMNYGSHAGGPVTLPYMADLASCKKAYVTMIMQQERQKFDAPKIRAGRCVADNGDVVFMGE